VHVCSAALPWNWCATRLPDLAESSGDTQRNRPYKLQHSEMGRDARWKESETPIVVWIVRTT
jgi:hypothetical protein